VRTNPSPRHRFAGGTAMAEAVFAQDLRLMSGRSMGVE
jgi:hypothetical protein